MRRLMSKILPISKSVPVGRELRKLVSMNEKASTSLSHELLTRLHLIESAYSGGYIISGYLLRSMDKLEQIIDKHLQAAGAQKIMMPHIAPKQTWDMTGRWEEMGAELIKFQDRTDKWYCLAPTHEETVCNYINDIKGEITHKTLPLLFYQTTTKFRDEPQPKHGLLRSKEFLMKDLYSFDVDTDSALQTYSQLIQSYENIFEELSLPVHTVEAASGLIGGSKSHEFQLQSQIGEDRYYICQSGQHAVSKELHSRGRVSDTDNMYKCMKCGDMRISEHRGIEVGHAFLLGDKYSRPLSVTYRDQDGADRLCEMGCYGLGVSRIISAALEVLSKPHGLRFPTPIVPYSITVMTHSKGFGFDEDLSALHDVYDELSQSRFKDEIVLCDHDQSSIGKKLRFASTYGFRFGVVTGRKLSESGQVEIVDLYTEKLNSIHVNRSALLQTISDLHTKQNS